MSEVKPWHWSLDPFLFTFFFRPYTEDMIEAKKFLKDKRDLMYLLETKKLTVQASVSW